MSLLQETAVLAPIEIWSVPFDEHRTIKFHEPLILTPTWMPDDPDEPREPDEPEYMDIICPELNIDVYADNIDDLVDFVRNNIRLAWKHIVLKDDSDLNAVCRSIKRNHLAIAEVIDA